VLKHLVENKTKVSYNTIATSDLNSFGVFSDSN
jgi:hypothetical protein